MTFKQFLEQGTTGEGPNASGQRGSNPLSSPSARKGQSKPIEGGKMSPGTQILPDKDKPAAPFGVGGSYAKWEPAKPSKMSPSINPLQGPASPSPFNVSMKFAKPKAGIMGAGNFPTSGKSPAATSLK